MKVKIIFTDETVLIFNSNETKKMFKDSCPEGCKLLVLSDYKTVKKLEFPTLKLTRKEIVELSERIHDLGNYFEDENEWRTLVDENLEQFNLKLGERNGSFIRILDENDDEIENFILSYSEHQMNNGVEIVSYNTQF